MARAPATKTHGLDVDPSDAVPIWKQIEDGVRRLVASAVLEPGSAVSSVRELARQLRVNPATVAKAYRRLTDAGVLTVRRGEGTFVADSPPAIPVAERDREVGVAAARYVAVASTIGATRADALRKVERAWDGLKRGSNDGGRK